MVQFRPELGGKRLFQLFQQRRGIGRGANGGPGRRSYRRDGQEPTHELGKQRRGRRRRKGLRRRPGRQQTFQRRRLRLRLSERLRRGGLRHALREGLRSLKRRSACRICDDRDTVVFRIISYSRRRGGTDAAGRSEDLSRHSRRRGRVLFHRFRKRRASGLPIRNRGRPCGHCDGGGEGGGAADGADCRLQEQPGRRR
ncbi:hypothetical protein SDC9_145018 [bioreactor metagenome]|uniref:Uncharacterized protein n=1 Tax=bioreactor metagenome TaxID=1076179 RepID=A0A645E9N0_9ZZZZ